MSATSSFRSVPRAALITKKLLQRFSKYYRGILLLTSNRAESIDRAPQSRIHLTLQYPDLQPCAREHIWRQFVAQSAESKVTDEAYARLAQLPVNGRQIKNVDKSATPLATRQDTHVRVEQIRTILRVTWKAAGVEI
ncbi:hypothetical protein INS49_010847 [Diaporthe citri]|uniref:uncharacterized protein n=1 Tax=Diaporthe citri TaxID=83186 RepID=UPI001C8258AA|nr:uncharacterized protein INS49_010847 [Diaporthe citri]KAG6359795.1 hypothetical protein INS49_010847 [Diaporthe citri]